MSPTEYWLLQVVLAAARRAWCAATDNPDERGPTWIAVHHNTIVAGMRARGVS